MPRKPIHQISDWLTVLKGATYDRERLDANELVLKMIELFANGSSYLEVGREGVWKPHVAGKGTQNQVPQLNAVGWDHITETIVIVAQELWEIMQQDQKNSQGALKESRLEMQLPKRQTQNKNKKGGQAGFRKEPRGII